MTDKHFSDEKLRGEVAKIIWEYKEPLKSQVIGELISLFQSAHAEAVKAERERISKELDNFSSPFTFKDESGMPWKFAGCKTWSEADWATTGYETAVDNIKQALSGEGVK